ncbi:hypothetical protein [Intrasporangium calvum]|uniref:Uncharacterized protein n=1 Tax=Intrasporangium calvum (strain ATCC 23552 / DSM 43043 / JCM 3097 / NBRC 12989 / NCIMB 10167 / NRRL B-3866 / 7 KIP) TaxID=710696 RepID=E6SBD3_INTC7|nr:hypothetical protein [Intrasporangium calvum]ADU49461.1 hypothetical protein Intca_2966 [Intrasporangium calvum DSM 43043]
MAHVIEPPNSVVLLVGRDEYTPPESLADRIVAATGDCVAVGVLSVDDGATTVELAPTPHIDGLSRLGEFILETEGRVSICDVYNGEYASLLVEPGTCAVTVWGNDTGEPDVVAFEVRPAVS